MIDSLAELLDVVEDMRSERYPNVPRTLVREIIALESSLLETPGSALAQIRDLVENAMVSEDRSC